MSSFYERRAVRVCRKFFPKMEGEWGFVDFNKVATEFQELISPIKALDAADWREQNLLLDPYVAGAVAKFVRKIKGIDYCFGGYMEDRSALWEGHYMKPGEVTHLGVDLGVPAITSDGHDVYVHLPVEAKLVHSFLDPDQDGGWGGKLIFEYKNCDVIGDDEEPRYLVLGHLKRIVTDIGTVYPTDAIVGRIAETSCNGGWSPHLHVQCMTKLVPDIDGYGPHYEGIENDFPDPLKEFTA